MEKFVIGVVGPIASGKGEVAKILKQFGFEYYSLSDRVREETRVRNLPEERETLQNVGNDLRRRFGNDVLAKRTIELINKSEGQRVVIDGIRNPGEIETLRNIFESRIIGVTASPDKRFELIRRRARPSDPTTIEEFNRLEQRDRGKGEGQHGQQVEASLNLADVTISNEGTLEELRASIFDLLYQWGIEGNRRSIESE